MVFPSHGLEMEPGEQTGFPQGHEVIEKQGPN